MKLYRWIWLISLCSGLLLFVMGIRFGVIVLDSTEGIIPVEENIEVLEKLSPKLTASASASSDVAYMLFTVQLALFVLIGFGLKDASFSKLLNSIPFATVSSAFIAVSFLSIYFGYLARFQALERVNAGFNDFFAVQDTLARQALWVGISAVLAIAAIPIAYFGAQGSEEGQVADKELLTDKPQLDDIKRPEVAIAETTTSKPVLFLAGAISTTIFLLGWTGHSVAEGHQCSHAEIAAVERKLPPLIPIGEAQSLEEVFRAIYLCEARAPAGGVAAAFSSGSSSSPTPTQRILVHLQSNPDGASLFVGRIPSGKTRLTALVRLIDLKKVRMEIEGYIPCPFDEASWNTEEQTLLCNMKKVQKEADKIK